MLTLHRQLPASSKSSNPEWIGPAPWIEVPPPGPLACRAVARDRRVSPFACTRPYPLVVRRGQGSIVEDVDRNRYLDFSAGMSGCVTGHCHPKVVSAIERQSRALLHMCGSDCCCEPMIALAERLGQLAPGAEAKRVLITSGETEAVQAAIQLSRDYTRREVILALEGCRERCGPPAALVQRVSHSDFKTVRNKIFRQLAAPDEVAAIFVEPMPAEAGQLAAWPEYLAGLRRLCDEHGILLVADEIQTGMGRTGRMFCCEHFGVAPDMLLAARSVASGLPLGAVIAREPLMEVANKFQGLTAGVSPASCAAALATIDLLQKQLVANAARLHPLALARLQRIDERYRCISSPRGMGLMLAVDVVTEKRSREPNPLMRDRIINEAFSRGLLLPGCGESRICFSPPLCINEVQLQVGLDVFDEAVATVAE